MSLSLSLYIYIYIYIYTYIYIYINAHRKHNTQQQGDGLQHGDPPGRGRRPKKRQRACETSRFSTLKATSREPAVHCGLLFQR